MGRGGGAVRARGGVQAPLESSSCSHGCVRGRCAKEVGQPQAPKGHAQEMAWCYGNRAMWGPRHRSPPQRQEPLVYPLPTHCQYRLVLEVAGQQTVPGGRAAGGSPRPRAQVVGGSNLVLQMRGLHDQAATSTQEGVQRLPPHARRCQCLETAPQRPAADDGGLFDDGDTRARRSSSRQCQSAELRAAEECW